MDWSELQVLFGGITALSAQVFVRLPPGRLDAEQRLVGVVSGPHHGGSRTLPATAPLRYLGPDPQPLARAKIADPALWTPEWPVRYRVEVSIEQAGETLPGPARWIGLRRFEAHDRSFFSDSRRTVIRGGRAAGNLAPIDLAAAWREQLLHVSPAACDDALLEAAASEGIPLLPRIEAAGPRLLETLSRWSQCAAIWAVVLPQSAAELPERELRGAAGNLLLASRASTHSPTLAPWAKAAVIGVEDDLDAAAAAAAQLTCPVLMERLLDDPDASFDRQRRACEQLQRDFAARGHYAGYLV